MGTVERCENCAEIIGSLETPFLWKERVVCARCHDRLNTSVPEAIAGETFAPSQTPVAPSMPGYYRRQGAGNPDRRKSDGVRTLVGVCCIIFLLVAGFVVFISVAGAISSAAKAEKLRDSLEHTNDMQMVDLAVTEYLDTVAGNFTAVRVTPLPTLRKQAIEAANTYLDHFHANGHSQAGQWTTEAEFASRLDRAEKLVTSKRKKPYEIYIWYSTLEPSESQ